MNIEHMVSHGCVTTSNNSNSAPLLVNSIDSQYNNFETKVTAVLEIRIKISWPFFEDRNILWVTYCCPTENIQVMANQMHFGQPNAEIGWKMANG